MFAHSDWVVATTQDNEALFLTLQVYSNGIWEDGKYWIYNESNVLHYHNHYL